VENMVTVVVCFASWVCCFSLALSRSAWLLLGADGNVILVGVSSDRSTSRGWSSNNATTKRRLFIVTNPADLYREESHTGSLDGAQL